MGPVVFLFEDASTLSQLVRERLPGINVVPCDDYAQLRSTLQVVQPDIILVGRCGNVPFPRSDLFACSSVKWIHSMSAGINHLAPWNSDVVTVTNSKGLFSSVIAQYVLWAMLSSNLRMHDFQAAKLKQQWSPRLVDTLRSKRLLVLGAGDIGGETVRLVRPLGVQTFGLRTRMGPDPDYDAIVGWNALEAVLPIADFVVNCLPLTASTCGRLDARFFRLMSSRCCFIDVGRGGVAVPTALLHGLKAGRPAAAFLDVFDEEPLPSDSEFWHLENVSVTCHSAGNVGNWAQRAVDHFCNLYKARASGMALPSLVSSERGY